jgi:hypothetical protein
MYKASLVSTGLVGGKKAHIQTAVYKATSGTALPPKEKHIRTIVVTTHQGGSEDVIKALGKRLDKSHWASVLKALMIFHRIFKDGAPSFIESLKGRAQQLFALRRFSTVAPANHIYTVFVKKYAKYLEEKVSVVRNLGFEFEKNKNILKETKIPKAFKIIGKLQSQLNALLNCRIKSQNSNLNALISRCYVLLLNDSIILYGALNDGLLHLLDVYWKLHQKEAKKVVEIYKLFVKETDALINLYDIGRRFIHKLPHVNKIETSIIEQMEAYAFNQAPKGSGGDYDDDDDDEGYNNNMNFLTNTQAGGQHYDEGAYAGQGSEEEDQDTDSADDEADPFESFITGTNNPFAGFTFSQPVFQSPYQQPNVFVQQPVMQTTNPFATNVATNPFANPTVVPITTNPFATNMAPQQQPSPFGQHSPSPFASPPVNQFGGPVQNDPYAGLTPSPFIQPNPVTSNPFATNTTNPFQQQMKPADPYSTNPFK